MGPSHVSHAWGMLVAVLFVVTGFLMTGSTAVAMTTPVANETLVRSSENDRYRLSYPVVDGDIVAWSEWDDESPTHSTRVCAYDVATALLRANGGPSDLQKQDLALDWPWLLWTQTVSGSDPTAPTDVYGWNLSSDSSLAVAAANGSQQVPAVSDGVAVWCDTRDGQSSRLYKCLLPNGTATPLDWIVEATSVAISESTVVYAEGNNVHVVDLVAHTDRVICSTYYSSGGLDVDGSVVVWADMRRGTVTDIYAYDLSSSTEIPICTAEEAQSDPRVSDGVVVWRDGRGSDIYGYEIASGSEFPVCALSTDARWEQGQPDISGDRVVWRDAPKGRESSIYTAQISFWDASVVIASGASASKTTQVSLALAADRWARDVVDMRLSPDGTTWSDWVPMSSPTTFSLTGGDGPKTIHAQFRDDSGATSPVVSDGILLDTTPPVTNSDADGLWHNGDVTVSLEPSDSGVGVASTHFKVDDGPTLAGVSVQISAPADHANDGIHSVTYWSVDVLGNSETPRTASVRIDTTPASLSTDYDGSWHNHDVLVALSALDPASGVMGISYSLDGSTWQPGTLVVVPGPSTHANDGLHTLLYRASDGAGNISSGTATVKIDTKAPNTQSDDAGWFNADKPVDFTATDDLSGVAGTSYSVDGTPWQQGSATLVAAPANHANDGQHTISYRSFDNAGNVESVGNCAVGIDTVAPSSSAKNADSAWHNAAFVLRLAAIDDRSGIAREQSSIDGGEWQNGLAVRCPDEGVHAVKFRAIDNAGNVESAKACQVRTDALPPSTTCGAPVGWQDDSASVTLASTDRRSGVAYTEFRLDGAGWKRGVSLSVTGNGAHRLTFRSVDKVGNSEATNSRNVLIDSAAPRTTAWGYAGWHSLPAKVTLEARDSGVGVAKTRYSLDGGPWATGASLRIPAPATHANDGAHTLRFYSLDRFGHRETVRSRVVRIDTRAPLVRTLANSDNRAYPYATLRYRVSEKLSPDVEVTIEILNRSGRVIKILDVGTQRPGTSRSARFRCDLRPGSYTYRVTAWDRAGNLRSGRGTLRVYVWWRDAAQYLGHSRTVLGPVRSAIFASSKNGQPTYLNIGQAYGRTPRFVAVIWGSSRSHFGFAPEVHYAGHLLTVTGRITKYKGRESVYHPRIIVSRPSQIRILR